jgi:integrase/recombinase XerD
VTGREPDSTIFFARSGSEFTPFGTAISGVPLFYETPAMVLIEAPTRWMFYLALERGRSASPKTWETYAEDLLDWLRTCHANQWNPMSVVEGHLGAYRTSMLRGTSKFGQPYAASTINARLNTVQRFYEWMAATGLIATYPFGLEDAHSSTRDTGLLGFARGAQRQERRSNNIRQGRSVPSAISIEALRTIVHGLRERDALAVKWALAAGPREDEILALNLSQIPNVSALRGISHVRVRIVKTKGLKPRDLRVPVRLIDDTWRYINGDRAAVQRRLKQKGRSPATDAVFLSAIGRRLSASTLWKQFHAQTLQAGVVARFHDLRHTFAIHRLQELRRGLKIEPDALFEPLLVLKAELGHEDLKATNIYLNSIEQDPSIVDERLTSLLDSVY